jgi:hypothetical protein
MTRLPLFGAAFVAALMTSVVASEALAQAAAPATPAPMMIKRTADGRPDLTGTWGMPMPAFFAPSKDAAGNICILACKPGDLGDRRSGIFGVNIKGEAPPPRPPPRDFPKYKPDLVAKVQQLEKTQVTTDPALRCQNPGLPRIGSPDKIMQNGDQVVFLYDDLNGSFWRIIPTDGRGHRADVDPNPLGDSAGRWEGDTLVVETNNFTEESWLTDNGAFHTATMTVVERLTPTPEGLRYEVIVNDPAVLVEPWKRQRVLSPMTVDLQQPSPCVEQSLPNLVSNEFYHDNPR